jgi:hypothetical protein
VCAHQQQASNLTRLPLLVTATATAAAQQLCYLSQYSGSERGVLVQMGPGPMFGHFPLGLFDEGMTKPAPTLEQQQQQQQQQQQKEGVKGA